LVAVFGHLNYYFTVEPLKKIILYIPTSKVAKEYTELFPFDELNNHYELTYLYGKPIFHNGENQYSQILFSDFTRKMHAFLHRSLLWYRKFSSLSYTLRAFQYFGLKKDYEETSNFLVYNGKRHKIIFRLLVYLFGNYFGIKILHHFLTLIFRLEHLKLKQIFSEDIACVIIPYGGGVSLEFDYIVWACKKNNIKSVAIQENWDNLSSKSLLLNHPTHFMTWGSQSSSHLRSIQKYRGSIKEIGSLRMNSLFNYRDTNLKNLETRNDIESTFRILIIGTGPATHDLKLVQYISSYLLSNSNLNYEIYFRPHPYFKNSEFSLKQVSEMNNVSTFIPLGNEKNIDRMNQILSCSVIVGLYSTVILEASILNKPCVIPSFIAPNLGYETYNFLNDLTHYAGISALENIHNAKSQDEFWSILGKIKNLNSIQSNNSKMLEWFCKNTNTSNGIVNYIQTLNNNRQIE